MREALPRMPSNRSRRLLKSSCLNLFTARTYEASVQCFYKYQKKLHLQDLESHGDESVKKAAHTYDCHQMTHVAGDGGIDLFVGRWLDDDSDIFRLGK